MFLCARDTSVGGILCHFGAAAPGKQPRSPQRAQNSCSLRSPRSLWWLFRITPQYFDAVGLALIRGRIFSDLDGTAGQANAIVNQRFASMYFLDGDLPLYFVQTWATSSLRASIRCACSARWSACLRRSR